MCFCLINEHLYLAAIIGVFVTAARCSFKLFTTDTDKSVSCVTFNWNSTWNSFRRNRSCSASDSAHSYTFLRSVVCLSVCHIRASCLNRSTDLDAIWQVHLRGSMTHCVKWSPWPLQAKGRFGVEHPAKTRNCKLQPMLPSTNTMQNTNEELGGFASCHSDSVFYQITLVLVNLTHNGWKHIR